MIGAKPTTLVPSGMLNANAGNSPRGSSKHDWLFTVASISMCVLKSSVNVSVMIPFCDIVSRDAGASLVLKVTPESVKFKVPDAWQLVQVIDEFWPATCRLK
jgi:hypothetical protein